MGVYSADWELGWSTQQVRSRPECSTTQYPVISNPEDIVVIKLFNNSILSDGPPRLPLVFITTLKLSISKKYFSIYHYKNVFPEIMLVFLGKIGENR